MTSTLTAKSQVTIPKEVRQQAGIGPGDKVKVFVRPDKSILLIPVIPVTALRGIIPYSGRPVTVEEMDDSIADVVAERDRASRER
jgi:antitoxin PrlF